MILKVDPSSPKPVYHQIITQIKYAVASGRLRPGDRLASIRDVASRTRTNRNTIARAYMELEPEGVIQSRAGRGSFISEKGTSPVGKIQARRILGELIDELLAQARLFNLTESEVTELLEKRLSKVRL